MINRRQGNGLVDDGKSTASSGRWAPPPPQQRKLAAVPLSPYTDGEMNDEPPMRKVTTIRHE